MLKGIDHVAIAVPSVDDAIPLWRDRFGFDLEDIEVVESEQVRVAILTKGPHRIELMEPTDEDSPVGKFLARRGPGIHHLCLAVDDIEVMLDHLGAAGVRLVDDKPKRGAHDKRVAFVHPKGAGGVLVELSE